MGGQILPWKVATPIPHDPLAHPRLQSLLVTSKATASSKETQPLLSLAPSTAPPCFPHVQLVMDTELKGGAQMTQLLRKPGVGELLTGHKSTNSKRKTSTQWPLENFRFAKESFEEHEENKPQTERKDVPNFYQVKNSYPDYILKN